MDGERHSEQERLRRLVTRVVGSIEGLLGNVDLVRNGQDDLRYAHSPDLTDWLHLRSVLDEGNSIGLRTRMEQDTDYISDGSGGLELQSIGDPYRVADIIVAPAADFRYKGLGIVDRFMGEPMRFVGDRNTPHRAYLRFGDKSGKFRLVGGSYWVLTPWDTVMSEKIGPDAVSGGVAFYEVSRGIDTDELTNLRKPTNPELPQHSSDPWVAAAALRKLGGKIERPSIEAFYAG